MENQVKGTRRRVLVVAVVSQKGGAGKTTIARNLAVAAGRDGWSVGVVDTDPQGSLSGWHDRRAADTPLVAALQGPLSDAVGALSEAGCDLIFIDTPPQQHPVIGEAVAAAALALTPVRPSPDDLDAVGPTLDIIEAAGRPFCFVVTQATANTSMLTETIAALAAHGRVAPAVLFTRQDYARAARDGLGVTESPGKAADDMAALWRYVADLLKKGHKE